jgi:pimeloyl-ACP methyl ester carboxylesterase
VNILDLSKLPAIPLDVVTRSRAPHFASQRPGVFRGGSGAPLVLLHAGGATWRQWTPILGRLTAERDVLALTLLGNRGGPSLLPGQYLTASAIADAVERELDATGLDQVDIVGNSVGGFAAFELARRRRARRVVAICPMGMQSEEKARAVVAALVDGHRKAVMLRPAILPALAVPHVRKDVLRATFGLVHGERVSTDLARHLFNAITSIDISMLADGPPDQQIRDVDEITSPTLVIHGDRDPIARRDQIDRYMAALPNARLVVLADAGHCPQLEQPGRVADEILTFTDSVVTRSEES